jgi:hypothetical protein
LHFVTFALHDQTISQLSPLIPTHTLGKLLVVGCPIAGKALAKRGMKCIDSAFSLVLGTEEGCSKSDLGMPTLNTNPPCDTVEQTSCGIMRPSE